MTIIKIMKIITSMVCVILIIIGFFGFFIQMGNTPNRVERSYDPKPLHEINGFAVDSIGNIYFGLTQHSSIQVYDNRGNFMYRFSFPTGGAGHFNFIIDYYDVVHVVVRRESSVFSFKDGYLIYRQRFENERERMTIINGIKRNPYSRRDVYGNIYTLTGSVQIRMYDSYGRFIRFISPSAPFFPLPGSWFIFISFFSSFALIGINYKFFYDLLKYSRNPHVI